MDELERKVGAMAKIATAGSGCSKAHEAWCSAYEALQGKVDLNHHAIYFNHGEQLRDKLKKAQSEITNALAALDAIEWPNSADYDAISDYWE